MLQRLQSCRSFDVFGRHVSLDTINGSKTYSTATGGLFTLLAVALFSLITYRVVSDFRDTTKPVVSVNTLKMKTPLEINFYEHGVLSGIGVMHITVKKIDELRKYVIIRPEIVTTTIDSEGKFVDKIESYNPTIIEHRILPILSSGNLAFID